MSTYVPGCVCLCVVCMKRETETEKIKKKSKLEIIYFDITNVWYNAWNKKQFYKLLPPTKGMLLGTKLIFYFH